MRTILYYQNRIDLLTNKNEAQNAKIISKLKRKIRSLERKV